MSVCHISIQARLPAWTCSQNQTEIEDLNGRFVSSRTDDRIKQACALPLDFYEAISSILLIFISHFKIYCINSAVYNAKQCFAQPYARSAGYSLSPVCFLSGLYNPAYRLYKHLLTSLWIIIIQLMDYIIHLIICIVCLRLNLFKLYYIIWRVNKQGLSF